MKIEYSSSRATSDCYDRFIEDSWLDGSLHDRHHFSK